MKVTKIESSIEKKRALSFLKRHSSFNLYLYEGIAFHSAVYSNLLFRIGRAPKAVAHSKSGTYLHLFILDNLSVFAIKRIARIIFRKLPRVKTIFGDKGGVERFITSAGLKPSLVREYTFMELERESYERERERLVSMGYFKHRGIAPLPEAAPLLLPLQTAYELEEVHLSASRIESSRLLALLNRRLAQGDITAIFEADRPIALAGVNAQFEKVCQIGSVYVVPGYRRKGYGYSVVLSHLERMFQRFGRVVLFVELDNQAASHLYKKIGFRPSGKLIQVFL